MKRLLTILLAVILLLNSVSTVKVLSAEDGEEDSIEDVASEPIEETEEETDTEEEIPEEEEEILPPEEEELPEEEVPEEENEIEYGGVTFALPERFSVPQKDIRGKQTLKDEAVNFALEEGIDCAEKELFFLCDDEDYARQVAEIYHGELKSFGNKVAVITITDEELSVSAAFEAAVNNEELPLVEPNYIIHVKSKAAQEEEDGNAQTMSGEDLYNNYGWTDWVWDVFGENADPFLTNPADFWSYYQWHHEEIGTYAGWNTAMGYGVTVGVIGDRIYTRHEEFEEKHLGFVTSKEFAISSGSYRLDGKGTHVASIIAAAEANAKGGAGIAPHASVIGYTVYDEGVLLVNVLCEAVEAAVEDEVQILDIAVTYPNYVLNMGEAIEDAYEAGIVVVAGAGDDGSDLRTYPAAYDHVIAVASSDHAGNRYYESNYGSWVTIAAPGLWIASADSPDDKRAEDDRYDSYAGTDQAAAVVSGALALYMSKVGSINYDQAVKVLKSSAKKAKSPKMGYGIVSVENMFRKVDTVPKLTVLGSDNAEIEDLSKPLPKGSCFFFNIENWGLNEYVLCSFNGKKPSIKNNVVINGEVYQGTTYNIDDFEKGKTMTVYAATVNGMGVMGKAQKYTIKTPAVEAAPVMIKKVVLDTSKLSLHYFMNGYDVNGQTYYQPNIMELVNINDEAVALNDVDHIWVSSNEKVCTVDEDGTIRATGAGTAKVTLKIQDGSKKTAVVNVTVTQLVTEVRISGPIGVTAGSSAQFKATVLPANAKNKKVKWELGVEEEYKDQIKLSSKGKLTVGKNVPENTMIWIRATSEDTMECKDAVVAVVLPKTKSVTINTDHPRAEYSKGKLKSITLFTVEVEDWFDLTDNTAKLTGTIEGNYLYPVWSSSNEKVATVDDVGNVYAEGPGKAVITCKAPDGSGKKATVTVNVRVPISSLMANTEDRYYLATGKSINASKYIAYGKAYGKPTLAKADWKIDYVIYNDGEGHEEYVTEEVTKGKTKLISVTSGGTLKTNSKLKKKYDLDKGHLYVSLKAEAKDGTGYFDFVYFYVRNPAKTLKFDQKIHDEFDSNLLATQFYLYTDKMSYFEISSNKDSIGSVRIDTDNAHQDPVSGLWEIPVYFCNVGGKPGTVTITVKTLDGSGKKATTKIVLKKPTSEP